MWVSLQTQVQENFSRMGEGTQRCWYSRNLSVLSPGQAATEIAASVPLRGAPSQHTEPTATWALLLSSHSGCGRGSLPHPP